MIGVTGGTSLFGGAGSAIGSIVGAFVMLTVGGLLIVFDINRFCSRYSLA